MDKLLRNTSGKISVVLYDSDGLEVDATGNVTVTIKDGAGTTVVSGTATKPASTTGLYEFTVSSTYTANLDVYTVTWTGTVSGSANTYTKHFEVVGGFYFSIAEARAFDQAKLKSQSQYPTADIINAREYVEERIEAITGASWVPRGRRVTVSGNGGSFLRLPDLFVKRVNSLSVDGTAYTSTELADVLIDESDIGVIYRSTLGYFPSGNRNVSVFYEYGLTEPPAPIKHAALMMLTYKLVPSDIDARATSFSDELGVRQFAVPGRKNQPTGIPEVDAILMDPAYNHRAPSLA